MTLKPIRIVSSGQLYVEDDDGASTVASAIAAHAALVSDVHGLLPTTAVDQDYYISMPLGNDSNDGLSKATPLRTWSGFVAKYGLSNLPTGQRRVHFAGSGGADPWVTPNAQQIYGEDLIDVGEAGFVGGPLVLRGPTNMPIAVPAAGPTTAALDAVTPARIINGTPLGPRGTPDAGGFRTELMFTAAAPGWTPQDLGPAGIGAFVRVVRAGEKRYYELPVADNSADTIVVDALDIVADLQAADTVTLVMPGAEIRGATDHGGGLRFVTIDGRGAIPKLAALVAADQGFTFERLSFYAAIVQGARLGFDRCCFLPVPGINPISLFRGATINLINCVAVDRAIDLDAASHETWNLRSRPDSAADPAVVAPTVGLMAKSIEIRRGGAYRADFPTSMYFSSGSGLRVTTGGQFEQACVYLGGDGSTDYGIFASDAGQVKVTGGTATTTAGATNDLMSDGVDAAYGTGAGDFEEAAGFNGNLHNTTVAAGVPSGGMARIHT